MGNYAIFAETKIQMTMKSIVVFIAVALSAAVVFSACGRKSGATESHSDADCKKALVCYFSATGTTRAAAERLARVTGADIHEIVPAELYSDADLDWRDSLSRSYVEMHNREMRPALADAAVDLTGYDVVFIGYPNWWNTVPTVVNTFIEANDLTGKAVVPFMTSGGNGIENSEADLRAAYPSLDWRNGLLLNGVSDDAVKEWADSVMH